MSFVKRLWKDRISQYPNRRTINDGYVTKQVTVGRDEGTVTEQGDAFNASNMNDLEDRIYAAIEQGGGGGGGGTYDYTELTNKPQVNGNELSGNKTTTNLGIYGSNTQMSAIDTTKVADRIMDLESLNVRTNIKSLVTFNETVTGTNTQIYVQGNVLYIFYQGESKAHSAGDSLFILPSGYRPSSLTYVVFLASNGINFITGDVSIESTTGECKVNQISNNSGAGRIYFTVAIPIG